MIVQAKIGRLIGKAMSFAQKRALKKAVKASALARRTGAKNIKRLNKSSKVQAKLVKVTGQRNKTFAKVTAVKVSQKQAVLAKESVRANLNSQATAKYVFNGAKKRAKASKSLSILDSDNAQVVQSNLQDVLKLAKQDRQMEKLTKRYAKLSKPITTGQVARRELATKAAAVVGVTAVAGATGAAGYKATLKKIKQTQDQAQAAFVMSTIRALK